ncbi:MAG: FRG domain-containing protein [Bryobacteraceae bacterium]
MNLDEITERTVSSPAELIDLQEQLQWPEPGSLPRRWAFRGQSQSYGTLVPSFQRIFGKRRPVGAAEIIERDLIKTFRQHYAGLQGRTSDMPAPGSIAEGYNLRCLSVMQHYGVPTRLLDWTSDFWTAVYFACASDPAQRAELWCYDRNIFNDAVSARPDLASLMISTSGAYIPPEPDLLSQRGGSLIVELDPRITPRMRQQSAHHTLSTDLFADHAPLLFDLARSANAENGLRRVLIEAGCKEKTLRFLQEHLQVTAGTIFPDVEGLGKFLHWHLESLVTTLL